jgi:LuxR family maltose regulon positive regulatory protein
LRTSILDRLTGPLCDAVTGGSHSDVLLEQIERTNLFLVPLDEQRQWYRYHHLFAEVLRARASREVGIKGLAALYTGASVWYEQNGMQALAIEAALSAGDFERASRLIDEPFAASMILSLQFATLIRWLECFPREQLFTNAFLCLTYAFSLFVSETPQAHESPLAVAERLFQAEGNHKGLGHAYMLRAIAARGRGDGVQAISYGAQALQLLPEDALLERSTATSALAEGYQLNGEVVAARRVLADARSLREQADNIPSILGDSIARGDLLIMQGKLREATDVYAPVPEAAGEWQYFAIQALIGLGNIAYECNELDKAETHLERAITLARKTRDAVLLARASLVRARVIQACGDAKRTSEAWASALMLAQECGYTGLVEQARAYQVRGWLQHGWREEAIQWQKDSSFAHDAPPSYLQEVLALTLVRCLLAQGETSEALGILERWRRHARVQERTGSEMEMLMLSALAYAKQGKAEQAVQLLQQALLLASPEGYIRVFVDEGVPMIALLSLVLSRWKSRPEADSLHSLLSVLQAEQPAQGAFSPTAPHQKPPLDPFTDRERKVLRLLSAGLSNAEIAAELMVSINTIRTQARSIYQKLNAKNRHEAVALARHWRLL